MSGYARDDEFWKTPPNEAQPPRPCQHPPSRRFAWIARDDTVPGGDVLVVACCDCGAVLQGGVDEVAQ